jgi:hypothetical protein
LNRAAVITSGYSFQIGTGLQLAGKADSLPRLSRGFVPALFTNADLVRTAA